MPINIGREMALPMEQIIGGPLQAIIQAQALAASATAEFIQSVGLVAGQNGQLTARTVDFKFQRKIPGTQTTNGNTVDIIKTEEVSLQVPLLTIVPVPFIRVQEATIDFEAKVSSSTLNQTDTQLGVSAEASGGFWGVKFSVKASYSKQSKFQDQVNRSATLTVNVKAVQDEIPAGLARVLDILETAVNDSDIEEVTV
jgi:hypothetical protein